VRHLVLAHPRLAPVFDAFEADRVDLAAYLAIAEEVGAQRVLDIGCGTGSLASLMAGQGLTVIGIDPDAAALEVARSKTGADRVTWIQGDATRLPALDTDLATMTGNVAQLLFTDDDWAATLRGVHAALRPGGHLVFETRRPEYRAWVEWSAEVGPIIVEVPAVGLVQRHTVVTDVSLPFISFRHMYRFQADGAVVTSDWTLRFRERDEVESSLVAQGLRVTDVRDAPDRPGREFVFIAQRPPPSD
jgi:SAM-dependent methyltransferase